VLSDTQKRTIQLDIEKDFPLPLKHNLVYLCLSSILQNALRELASHASPKITITLGENSSDTRRDRPWIRITDNGSGIAPDVLNRLLNSPTTTYEGRGGHGMGLMFCKKVMLSLAGNISIETQHKESGFSPAHTGTSVSLHFQPTEE
jgi:C4-dicarboxylate-specific signal transduction histidine kinase